MRLTLRLVLAFGLLASFSTAGLGFVLRESRVIEETARFDRELSSTCRRTADEIKRQAESDRRLVSGACEKGDLVDRTLVAMEAGALDERRLALAASVPPLKEAFGFESLVLATGAGEVLGAEPRSLLSLPADEVKGLIGRAPHDFLRGTKNVSGLISRCTRGETGRAVALVGVRDPRALAKRLSSTDIEVEVGKSAVPPSRETARSSCVVEAAGTVLPLTVSKSKGPLFVTLERIDRTILYAAIASASAALFLGILLARSLSRPLADLASEAGKVAQGEARPITLRGSPEVRDVARAFNRMLGDLEGTRRRLDAATRVAAWREVARRVAHEVKNPLAPIRAAVETLRRLRARNDPAFDEYFDEATRTVLDEVHRISNIVTEFTKFARLPAPQPKPENVAELANRVVTLQRAVAGPVKIEVHAQGGLPEVRCDDEQVVQVLTNLIQNAVEASKGTPGAEVVVDIAREGEDRVALVVKDSGPGVAPDMVRRLFEPYATTKAHGTGLGLAIAQRIALEHGGELAYVAKAERGATFRFVLPVAGPGEREGDRESLLPRDGGSERTE